MLLLVLSLFAQVQSAPVHCGTAIFDAMKPARPVPMPTAGKDATPPRMGEKRLFWLQNMSVMPPVQYQDSVTCRGTGDHCYVMVQDSVWTAGLVDSADVTRIIERFDHSSPRDSLKGVWDHNTGVLGQPPLGIDNDSLVYLIYQNVGEFHGYLFDGFWQYFDEYYDTTSVRLWGYHSNEIECVYLDCYPNNPAQDYRIAIAAHEFGHMIHWNYDQAESLWVNEGCAELAMWLYGSPDPISGFTSAPDNDLTKWTGEWSDYIKTYLYFLFVYGQYGGRMGTDLIHNVVASPFVSIEGIDSAFAQTGIAQAFEGALDHWALTNIINDTSYLDGKYGYYGEDVPKFGLAGMHSTYPVSRTGTLDRWAGEFARFQRGRDLTVTFDGDDNGLWNTFVVVKDSIGHRMYIDTMQLDANMQGSAFVPGTDTAWQSVWLAPVNHYPYGRMSYAYGATATGIEENPAAPGSARFAGPSLVRAGSRLALAPGQGLFTSDGRLATTGQVKPGVYWVGDPNRPGQRRKLVVTR